MPKNLLTILNIISASPIIIYPILFLSSFMILGVPGSGKPSKAIVMAWLWLSYPVFIVVLIFLSRKFKSISLALIACVPFVFMFAFAIIALVNEIKRRIVVKEFISTLSKDFVCITGSNANKFITVDLQKNQLIMIDPTASDSYFTEPVGKMKFGNLELFYQLSGSKDQYGKCLNSEGKSIFDLYKVTQGKALYENYDLKKYKLD
jgi:hypothetical protein